MSYLDNIGASLVSIPRD